MTVAELIEELKKYDPNLTVTGYCADESTSTITKDSINFREGSSYKYYDVERCLWIEGEPHLDIMGG